MNILFHRLGELDVEDVVALTPQQEYFLAERKACVRE
jgi:hypothetical protein